MYSQDNQDKWQPDSQKYNTVEEPEKKRRPKWWIPVVIVIGLIVIGITAGFAVGILYLRNNLPETEQEEVYEENESETIEIEKVSQTPAQSLKGGVILTDVSDVVEEVMPSVVSVTSRSIVNDNIYWGFFFGYAPPNQGSAQEIESGIGSGTIVGRNESELLILTSYHVVEGSSSLYVTFYDEQAVDGYIKAVSEEYDIAVVAIRLEEIAPETLKAIKQAELCADKTEVGEGVIVIGNALGYGQSTVTGVVSANDRQIKVKDKTITVIQTDAAINAGNSGGCMLNSSGQVIGISEAKISGSTVEGMCYAISINEYYDLIQDMLEMPPADNASVEEPVVIIGQGAYLGIYGRDIDKKLAENYGLTEGIYVLSTVPGSGARQAGIRQGDVIVGVDGKEILTMATLQGELASRDPGDEITLKIMRPEGNKYEEIEVTATLTAAVG
ncbi:MAG: S1C family serine protease [Lachnospiraceae bacterium]|jgi:serine protease Do